MNPDDPSGQTPPPPGGFQRPPGWYDPAPAPPPAAPPSPPPPPPSDGGYPGGYQGGGYPGGGYQGGGGYPGGGYPGGSYRQEPDPWDEDQGRDGPPWEEREEIGTIAALFKTVTEVLMHPGDTFASAKRTGGLGGPLGYAVLGGVIMMVLWSIVTYGPMLATGRGFEAQLSKGQFGNVPPAEMDQIMEFAKVMDANLPLVFVGGLVMICTLFPLMICMQLFVSSAVTHVCLMIVGGAQRDFETTFRVVAYVMPSSLLLNAIPICGPLIGLVWNPVAKILGLREMHETDTWRVVLAVFLPMLVCCACIGGGIAIALPGMVHAFQQGAGGVTP